MCLNLSTEKLSKNGCTLSPSCKRPSERSVWTTNFRKWDRGSSYTMNSETDTKVCGFYDYDRGIFGTFQFFPEQFAQITSCTISMAKNRFKIRSRFRSHNPTDADNCTKLRDLAIARLKLPPCFETSNDLSSFSTLFSSRLSSFWQRNRLLCNRNQFRQMRKIWTALDLRGPRICSGAFT